MSYEMEFVPAHPTNYRVGRQLGIDMIVVHTTESTKASAVEWFKEDHAPSHKPPTSAHLVVGQDKSVTQCVDLNDTAFHAGNWPVNCRSIGIECEGYHDKPETWTEPLIDTLVALMRDLCHTHQIPINRAHIIGHREVPNPLHPGQFGGVGDNEDPGTHIPWDRIMAALTAE